MPRPASGSVEVRKLRDGTSSVRARFRHKGERYPVVFGRDVDGWTEARGRRELQMILAQLSAGVPIEQVLARYEPKPAHDEDEYAAGITMHEYASDWLERRRVGEIGEGPLAESTYEVLAYDKSGQPTKIADGFHGNDIVVRHDGGIYVTNPVLPNPGQPGHVWYISPKGEKRIVDSGLKLPCTGDSSLSQNSAPSMDNRDTTEPAASSTR